jgi:flagellar motor switch protein FliN/FliY
MPIQESQQQALMHLGASTAEAVAQVLEMFVADGVERGDVTVGNDESSPFTELPLDGIAASVRYVDGVTGANVFLMTEACARSLASAMGVPSPESGALTELEVSAIGEAANQMLGAAASAISVVIGQEIEISPPDVRVLTDKTDAIEVWGTAPYTCCSSFTINGEPCQLVQLVPNAFVVRVGRAIDELAMEHAVTGATAGNETIGPNPALLSDTLNEIRLKVWAELGRTQIPLGTALQLPAGAVIDLDQGAESPVDLFVNGLCFGHGHLLVTDDGQWAIEVESLTTPSVRELALVGGTDSPT